MNQRRRLSDNIPINGLTGRKAQEIFDSIDEGNWRKVRKMLKAFKRKNTLQNLYDSTGLTPLAYAVSCRAPQDVIETMLQIDPDVLMKTDKFGASPLHLACLNGTTYATVKLLLDSDKKYRAVRIVDHSCCSVLHHAVEYACLVIESKYSNHRTNASGTTDSTIATDDEEYLDIIQLLCNVAPDLVFSVGINGDTPLDIPNVVMVNRLADAERHERAIEREIERRLLQVYRILKKTSINLYRKRKADWENTPILSTSDEKDSKSTFSSMSSSNASARSAQGSHTLSLFKDSVTGDESQQMDTSLVLDRPHLRKRIDETSSD
mmetsp:Transcript_10064/g.12707  ORF Transcript_10064/g.12707 Transcript_10064/m.12707 type:complete len:321 (+) Transcript_10064:3-965(+)